MRRRVHDLREEVSPQDLLGFLEELAPELRSPASLAQVSSQVKRRFGIAPRRELLASALARSPLFARCRRGRYATREALLRGALFRVEPTPEELEWGVLVPGHRFLPLWWGGDAEALIAEDADGETVSFTDLRLSFARALPYHYLVGYNWLPDFVRDHTDGGVPESRTFRVLDMARFYAKTGFEAGDFVLLEIENPWERKVVLRYERRRDACARTAEIRAADIALEKALLAVFEAPYVLWSVPEQIFQSLAAAPPSVLKYPGSTFERFLGKTPSFELQEVGLELAAFPRGTTPFQLAMRRSLHEERQPDIFADPLDQLLTRLGINMHSASIRGILRLAASENRTYSEVVRDIIPWERLHGSTPEDRRVLGAHLRSAWRSARDDERRRPLSQDLVTLLREAATLKQRVLLILRQLDMLGLKTDELPSRPLLRIVEIDELAECILQLDLGGDGGLSHRTEELTELLSDVGNHLDRIGQEILQQALA